MLTQKVTPVRLYEGVYLLKPAASEEKQKDVFKKLKSALKDFRGTFYKIDTWGTRSLAQPVDQFQQAVYFHAWFQSEPQGIYELERLARLNPFVLRFYHTRLNDSKSLSEHEEFFKDVILKQAQLFLEKKQQVQQEQTSSTTKATRKDKDKDKDKV